MEKGKIELIPRSKKGNVFMLCEGEFTYPEDAAISTETFEQLLDRCIPEGSESYPARGLVHSIEVVNVPEPVKVRELYRDGTVKEFVNKEISYEELYQMYKASIDEQKVLSEELATVKDRDDELYRLIDYIRSEDGLSYNDYTQLHDAIGGDF